MKTIKLPQILLSLALIAVVAFAAFPASSAHALSSTSATPILASTQAGAPGLAAGHIIVCKNVTAWRNGHRVTVRICHRVEILKDL